MEPSYTVDTFRPDLIPPLLPPHVGNPERDVTVHAAVTLAESWALRVALTREAGAGPTILAALEDFAAIAWEAEPEDLLRTVVWVRETETGRMVATGHYRPSDISRDHCPILEVGCTTGDDRGLYQYKRVPDGTSYRAVLI